MNDIILNAPTVSLILGAVIPLLVGLATKLSTSSAVKSILMLVLNAIQSLVVTATQNNGAAVLSKEMLTTFIVSTIISAVSYTSVYKPSNLTSSKVEGKLGPNKGIL